MARMPRNQLLDLLFRLFGERETWPIKLLREKTQQPELFLKETLSDIAFLHRSGEHNGTWELKENFKEGVRVHAKPTQTIPYQLMKNLRRKPKLVPVVCRVWVASMPRWKTQARMITTKTKMTTTWKRCHDFFDVSILVVRHSSVAVLTSGHRPDHPRKARTSLR